MRPKHLILGFALVCLIASCEKKEQPPVQPESMGEPCYVDVRFHFMYGKDSLKLHEYFLTTNGDSIRIDRFSLLLTEIMLWSTDQFGEGNSPKEVDPVNHTISIFLYFLKQKHVINTITFTLGADSFMVMKNLTAPGPMDQNAESFWGKDSGYVHVNLEGELRNNGTSKPLVYHIGGYRYPFNTNRKFVLNFPALPLETYLRPVIHLTVDLSEIFQTPYLIGINTVDQCLGPGETAFRFAENYADMIRLDHVNF